jgi:hypothetical protein
MTLSYNYPTDGSALQTNSGAYWMSAVATGDAAAPIVTAACVKDNGVTRIVQARLNYPNSIYEYAVVSGNTAAPELGFGNFYLGGTGNPVNIGGNLVGGADHVSGDMYVSNVAFLRGPRSSLPATPATAIPPTRIPSSRRSALPPAKRLRRPTRSRVS